MSIPGISAWSSRAVFGASLFFGLLAMTARTATDPDIWWHLRTGQSILETGHVPRMDPYSFTRSGEPWVSHEWLTEVVFYALWKLGGPAALIVFSSVITTLGFFLLYLRCPGPAHWAAALTVLGACASLPCWGARPQMFTFVLASLLIWLIERAEARPRVLLWIPPIFLLWLNLHAGFALALALMLFYVAGLMVEVATGAAAWSDARPIVLRMALTTLVCLVLVPVNPSGARLYSYPFDTLRLAEARSFIVEWLSPDFHRHLYTPLLIVILLLFVALAWSRARLHGRVFVPLAFMMVAALDAVRHVPVLILLAIPVLARSIPQSSNAMSGFSAAGVAPRLRSFINVAAVLFMAIFAFVRYQTVARNQAQAAASDFPSGAVAFLRSSAEPSRLFAYYDWGGFVIWNLYPEYCVFIDGRSDVFGDEILKQFENAVLLHDSWRPVLDGWHVETVLIPRNSALAQALDLDPDWTDRYRDSQAVVFVRSPTSDHPMSGPLVWHPPKVLPPKVLLMALSSKPAKSEKMIGRGMPKSAKLGSY